MRALFPQFYDRTPAELDRLWRDENTIISFDANVLLNIYSYSDDTLKLFFNLLEQLQSKIWISHQAAYEFSKNRRNRIDAQESSLKNGVPLQRLTDFCDSVANLHHPIINYDEIKGAAQQLQEQLRSFSSQPGVLDKYRQRCEESTEQLQKLLLNRIGSSYSDDQMKAHRSAIEIRFKNLQPPGFLDAGKAKKSDDEADQKERIPGDPYGDCIVWFQLLDHMREIAKAPKGVIFVTDEADVDWWWKRHGKTIGPRPELVAEMHKIDTSFYMYSSKHFIEWASQIVSQRPNKEEVNSAMKEAEDLITNSWYRRGVDGPRTAYKQAKLSHATRNIRRKVNRLAKLINRPTGAIAEIVDNLVMIDLLDSASADKIQEFFNIAVRCEYALPGSDNSSNWIACDETYRDCVADLNAALQKLDFLTPDPEDTISLIGIEDL